MLYDFFFGKKRDIQFDGLTSSIAFFLLPPLGEDKCEGDFVLRELEKKVEQYKNRPRRSDLTQNVAEATLLRVVRKEELIYAQIDR